VNLILFNSFIEIPKPSRRKPASIYIERLRNRGRGFSVCKLFNFMPPRYISLRGQIFNLNRIESEAEARLRAVVFSVNDLLLPGAARSAVRRLQR